MSPIQQCEGLTQGELDDEAFGGVPKVLQEISQEIGAQQLQDAGALLAATASQCRAERAELRAERAEASLAAAEVQIAQVATQLQAERSGKAELAAEVKRLKEGEIMRSKIAMKFKKEAEELRQVLSGRSGCITEQGTQTESSGAELDNHAAAENALRLVIEELKMKLRQLVDCCRSHSFGAAVLDMVEEVGLRPTLEERDMFQRLHEDALDRVKQLEQVQEQVRREQKALFGALQAEPPDYAAAIEAVEQSQVGRLRRLSQPRLSGTSATGQAVAAQVPPQLWGVNRLPRNGSIRSHIGQPSRAGVDTPSCNVLGQQWSTEPPKRQRVVTRAASMPPASTPAVHTGSLGPSPQSMPMVLMCEGERRRVRKLV
eukprot:gnl/TRDRNA2_/TRDRNA2_189633_c0_seq1.p1 gnl/TRDRNA2_/TRDRNA2_189633_c0~~gnl/TRDRNA2_/TRDRNA2_189633_c0_seq1.p1  ORF type:complete len:373 (+),score=94.58 gnl/TRDRNA2_/TRDRNA2_189633_c0_seq1:36-1154(+)